MKAFYSVWHARLRAGFGSAAACVDLADHLNEKGAHGRAVPFLARAAKAGSADAQMRLGKAYLTGPGLPPNIGQALRWLHQAAEGGHREAQVQLAELALQGVTRSETDRLFNRLDRHIGPDWDEAFRLGIAAADAGSVQAKALLAFIMTEGPAERRNEVTAEALYRQAADAGWPQAQLGLALLRLKSTDTTEARLLLRDASAAGLPLAHYWRAVLAESGSGGVADPAEAADHYRLAAEAGCRPAQTRFGFALLHGRGVPQDRFQAETWLRRAAIAGDIQAAAVLGVLAADATDGAPNYAEAVAWLEPSAEAGHPGAARSMAQLYRLGQGVPRDLAQSKRWLRAAAAAGDSDAIGNLAALAFTGDATPEEQSATARWLLEAAHRGDTSALFKLGLCMATGVAVRPNAALARRCYLAAAKEGQADAAAAAGEMLVNGRGGPADRQRGLDLFRQAASQGHSGAKYALGVLLSNVNFLRAAADAGHPQAQAMLQRLAPA